MNDDIKRSGFRIWWRGLSVIGKIIALTVSLYGLSISAYSLYYAIESNEAAREQRIKILNGIEGQKKYSMIILNEIESQKYPMRFILSGFENEKPPEKWDVNNLNQYIQNDKKLSLVDDFIKGLKPCGTQGNPIKIKIYGFASHTGWSNSNNRDLANRRGEIWKKYIDDLNVEHIHVDQKEWNTYEEMRFHIPLQDNISDEKDESQHIFTRSARMYIDPGRCGRVD